MEGELILFVLLPLGVAMAALVGTLAISIRNGSVIQWLLTAVALPCALLAVQVFVRMLRGAWPTYGAHLLTAVATAAVIAQLVVASKRARE